MLINFFFALKQAGVPVSIDEYLHLIDALRKNVIPTTINDLYYLARTTLVKSESNYDRFDKAFSMHFSQYEAHDNSNAADLLLKLLPDKLTNEEISVINSDDLSELTGLLKDRTHRELKDTAQFDGGNAVSPFGAGAEIAGTIRIGNSTLSQRAKKIWEERSYREYDARNPLVSRNLKSALRRLRKYARLGSAEEELDMAGTLRETADNAGLLTIKMQPERKNRFRVVILLDVGGTMAEHAALSAELFSAAKTEFRHMEFFYFHNCIYEHLWKGSRGQNETRTPTWDIIRSYGKDTRVIFVGDAKMAPAELMTKGGSIEYNNEEPGEVWLERLVDAYPQFIWLNPEPVESWDYRESIVIVKNIMKDRMFPLTIEGIERGMKLLSK